MKFVFNEGGANERALQLAKGWLIKERNDDFHWGRSTALALLALSRIPSWNSGSIESWLSIRQMYIDFLLQKIKQVLQNYFINFNQNFYINYKKL